MFHAMEIRVCKLFCRFSKPVYQAILARKKRKATTKCFSADFYPLHHTGSKNILLKS